LRSSKAGLYALRMYRKERQKYLGKRPSKHSKENRPWWVDSRIKAVSFYVLPLMLVMFCLMMMFVSFEGMIVYSILGILVFVTWLNQRTDLFAWAARIYKLLNKK